jgi:hypothetical protein
MEIATNGLFSVLCLIKASVMTDLVIAKATQINSCYDRHSGYLADTGDYSASRQVPRIEPLPNAKSILSTVKAIDSSNSQNKVVKCF